VAATDQHGSGSETQPVTGRLIAGLLVSRPRGVSRPLRRGWDTVESVIALIAGDGWAGCRRVCLSTSGVPGLGLSTRPASAAWSSCRHRSCRKAGELSRLQRDGEGVYSQGGPLAFGEGR
jgi:hypothetical protein